MRSLPARMPFTILVPLLALVIVACASSGARLVTSDPASLARVRSLVMAPCNVDALTLAVCDSAAAVASRALEARLPGLISVPPADAVARLGVPDSSDAPAWVQYAREHGADGVVICFVTAERMESGHEDLGDTFVSVDLRSGAVGLEHEKKWVMQTHWIGALVTLEVVDVATTRVILRAESNDTKAFPADVKVVAQISAAVDMAGTQLRQALSGGSAGN